MKIDRRVTDKDLLDMGLGDLPSIVPAAHAAAAKKPPPRLRQGAPTPSDHVADGPCACASCLGLEQAILDAIARMPQPQAQPRPARLKLTAGARAGMERRGAHTWRR